MRTRNVRAAGALGIASAVAIASASFAATSSTSANFVGNDVVNSSATTSLAGWQASSAASAVNLTRLTGVRTPAGSTAIDIQTAGSTGDWGEVLGDLTDPAFITPGKTYRMSVWVRDMDASGNTIGMVLANANYQHRPSDDWVYEGFHDTKWHQLTRTFVAKSAAAADTAFYIGLSRRAQVHIQATGATVSVLSSDAAAAAPLTAPQPTTPAPVTTTAAAPVTTAPAAPATTAPATTAPAAPAANTSVPGFNLIFDEGFNANAAAGQFLSTYGAKWGAYNGFRDTDRLGNYNQNILSVNNGILDMYLHTENGVPQVAAPVPFINGTWGGSKYGRYEVRFRADSLANYKTAWLLWPDTNNWSDGEIDFPEGELNGTIYAFNHQIGNPSQNALAANTGASFGSWHTATTEWTPSGVKFYLDGALVGSSSVSPSVPMHMVLQTETSGQPAASTAGHVQVDSVRIWSYTG